MEDYSDDPLDPGIEKYVRILREHGIETYESCQGGDGHSYPHPAIRFHGHFDEGFRAFAIARCHQFPIAQLNRVWIVEDGEPVGPTWEIVLTFPDG